MNRMMFQWTLLAVGVGSTTLGCSGSENGDSGAAESPNATDGETVPDLTITEEFTQTSYDAVSILWVVDPAWDEVTDDHIAALPKSFYSLLNLHGVPWKVGIMSPSSEPASVRGTITNVHTSVPIDPNWYNVFGGGEMHFRGVVSWTLTERLEEFDDFYFGGGHLSLIAFADEADDSPAKYPTRSEFLDLLDKQNAAMTVSISAITVGDQSIRSTWEEYARETNGLVSSSTDIEGNLERMVNASLGLTKEFRLAEVPAFPPAEIIRTYRGNQTRLKISEDYRFDVGGNFIEILGPTPLSGTKLTVSYQRRVEGVMPDNDKEEDGGN